MAILLSYKNQPMHFFGDGEWEQKVDMFIEKTYLFGLIKRKVKIIYTITMFDNLKDYYNYWNELIKTKEKIKI